MEDTQEILNRTKTLKNNISRYLQLNGAEYNLSEWVTIKDYANMYNLSSTSVVSNWIERGVVPTENVVEIPELNDLRLIKNVRYR